jgi:hypothetical protein
MDDVARGPRLMPSPTSNHDSFEITITAPRTTSYFSLDHAQELVGRSSTQDSGVSELHRKLAPKLEGTCARSRARIATYRSHALTEFYGRLTFSDSP